MSVTTRRRARGARGAGTEASEPCSTEVEAAVPVRGARTFVAVAGTATTIQAIALGLDRYDPDLIHRTR